MRTENIQHATLTLNRHCNLRCQWCYAQGTEFRDDLQMSAESAHRLVDICVDMGIGRFILIGGEPTLHKDFWEIVKHILDRRGRLTVATNGLCLKTSSFSQHFAQIATDRLQFNISLKGTSDEEYLKNCGVGAFSTVIAGIENCSRHGLRCSCSYVVTSDNALHLVDFATNYRDLGLCRYPLLFDFCRDMICGEKKTKTDRKPLTSLEINRVFNQQYKELHEILGGRFVLHQTLPLCMVDSELFELMRMRNQIMTTCPVTRGTGVIFDVNGGLLLCNHLVGFSIGKFCQEYDDSQSFVKFLESARVSEARWKLSSMPSYECMTCGKASECGGGCCVRWFYENFETMKREAKGKEVKR